METQLFYIYDQHFIPRGEVVACSHDEAIQAAKRRRIHAPMVQSEEDIKRQERELSNATF